MEPVGPKQLRKQPYDKNHPREEQRRRVQDAQLKALHGTELENQKVIQEDLRSLSDKHALHGEAQGEVDRIAREQEVSLREAMKSGKYTGMRPEGPDHAYRAWVDSEFRRVYPDTEPDDRDLNPSSGRRLGG